MTLEEQIQETIVKYLDDYRPDHKECECSNCLYFIHELKNELLALIADQVREAKKNAYGKGFSAGWTARSNAVEAGGARPMSQKTKDRIAELQANPLLEKEQQP